jgi:hypothetical protein
VTQHLIPDHTAQTGHEVGTLAPPLTSSDPGSFAWRVLHKRHPALIEQVRSAHPYQPCQHAALDQLRDEITVGTVRPLPPETHDYHAWQAWNSEFVGKPWDQAPFLWAESYFYRRLLHAVGFFTPGVWYWLDPFEHLKAAELGDPALETDLAKLNELQQLPICQRGQVILLASLWGNRADLGFTLSAGTAGIAAPRADLVVDDTRRIWSHLDATPGTVCLVADNAGRELLADLILIDHLVQADLATDVVLHVKPTPYYVSDVVVADVAACLRRLAAAPGCAADAASRLRAEFRNGRVRIDTHWFYCAPRSFHDAPPSLLTTFASASLTIMKGDLNYRRLVGDCDWEPRTPFSETTDYLPGPVATLRTLKSDVVVGINPDMLAHLDATDHTWRTNGTHGLVQAHGLNPGLDAL